MHPASLVLLLIASFEGAPPTKWIAVTSSCRYRRSTSRIPQEAIHRFSLPQQGAAKGCQDPSCPMPQQGEKSDQHHLIVQKATAPIDHRSSSADAEALLAVAMLESDASTRSDALVLADDVSRGDPADSADSVSHYFSLATRAMHALGAAPLDSSQDAAQQ